MSFLRFVSPASILRAASSTAPACSRGTKHTPASSAQTRSPGLTWTPQTCTFPFTSTVCMRYLPVIGVNPRHVTALREIVRFAFALRIALVERCAMDLRGALNVAHRQGGADDTRAGSDRR